MSATLKGNSLSFIESLMMGVAGSAPASSIALGMAALIGTAGLFAPASLLLFSVPMLGIARAYQALGARDASAGAAYQWTSAVFGRFLGFFSGWALLVATLIFMVSGSIPIATATLDFVAPDQVGNVIVTAVLASFWFAIVAAIVIVGITVTSRIQVILTSVQLLILSVVLIAAFIHSARGGIANHIHWSWMWGGLSAADLAPTALIAVYFYWGWDVTSNLAEETVGGGSQAGRGGLVSIFITIVLYVGFSLAALLVFPIESAQKLTDNIVFDIAVAAGLGRPGGLLASVAVILSSVAALEATMVMFSRTLFAMGRDGSMPRRFGEVHAGTHSPARAMYVLVALGVAFIWASALMPSVKLILFTSVKALGLQVDYYFGLAGLAAAWRFRNTHEYSISQWLNLCAFPALSSVVLIGLGAYATSTFDWLTNALGIGGFLIGLAFYRSRSYLPRSPVIQTENG